MSLEMKHILRGVVGVVGLAVLAFMVWGWIGDYRDARESVTPPAAETTATPTPEGEETKTAPAEGEAKTATKTVIVTIDGLNFREKPASDAKAIRGLEKGEKLVLIKTQEGWYQVKDADGRTGWISSNPQYSKVEE